MRFFAVSALAALAALAACSSSSPPPDDSEQDVSGARCKEDFVFPFGGESSVELRGDYRPGAFASGDAMTHVGDSWRVTVDVPSDAPVKYKFFVNGKTFAFDPGNPDKETEGNGA